ncbi:ketosynthase chain-length factor [Amycolatopsis regifaucium]|uniref:Beta-ketoacyl synthase n=1 Tax=Amycolatopsis regifaucium TaxID=546365 RepID=A0A154MWE4_9PSEU|nr:ketosynthase chain-length factor [Amycolatopsis regifaucium]KZB88320.1 beta-ketoacyl synthase [Amycolatopsis regifaucium]OKA11432.1 ketosynthase chain-length factor [Amycolatopsis regifaucium]SFH41955.1 act minimal PKS chain-length factor (CLF/KS beta) [Amycolatopsis regifaucium]
MTDSAGADRPVVTGIGVVAPTGIGTAEHWRATLDGRSGIGYIDRFDPASYPVRHAGKLRGFAAEDHLPGRLLVETDLWTQTGLVASHEALADAALDPATVPEFEMAVLTSSSSGGVEFGQREMASLWQNGPRISAYQSIAWFYAATTGQLAIRHGMRGACGVICAEQAGGLDTLGHARKFTAEDTKVVVAGGTDAPLCPYSLVAQLSNGRLSTEPDPRRAYLPFDEAASGYLPGEGGAILIVEGKHAHRERGAAHSYGEVAGYAAGMDPRPGSPRPPALTRVIRAALADAGLGPGEIDVVFADAAGSAREDLLEARAITEVFGARAVPVTAPKTLVGRLYGGGAALDVATALLALRDGVIPHTDGTTRLAPGCDIDLVRSAPREAALTSALVLARGYGGFTSALVLRKTEPDGTTQGAHR